MRDESFDFSAIDVVYAWLHKYWVTTLCHQNVIGVNAKIIRRYEKKNIVNRLSQRLGTWFQVFFKRLYMLMLTFAYKILYR